MKTKLHETWYKNSKSMSHKLILFNTLTAMSTIYVDMAVFIEAASTIFVDGYLSVFSAVNNRCIRPMLFLWH